MGRPSKGLARKSGRRLRSAELGAARSHPSGAFFVCRAFRTRLACFGAIWPDPRQVELLETPALWRRIIPDKLAKAHGFAMCESLAEMLQTLRQSNETDRGSVLAAIQEILQDTDRTSALWYAGPGLYRSDLRTSDRRRRAHGHSEFRPAFRDRWIARDLGNRRIPSAKSSNVTEWRLRNDSRCPQNGSS